MKNVAQSRKPGKIFYAHLFDQAGVLAKVNGQILFLDSDSGALVEIEPAMCNFLTVLGEVGLAEQQALWDQLRGGYAQIACTRHEGVS